MRRTASVACFPILLGIACQERLEVRPIQTRMSVGEVPAAGASDDADAGEPKSDAGPPTECPTGAPGQAMVEFETPGGLRYCMDRTEVTQAHYAEFLAAAVPVESQTHPLCRAQRNTGFSPLAVKPA